MAWVSPKVIKILDSLGEKSLIEKIPSMEQEAAEKAVDEAFHKSGKESVKTTNGDRRFGKKTGKNTFIDDDTGEESALNDAGELIDEEFDADRDEDTDIDSELYEQKEVERRIDNLGSNEFEENKSDLYSEKSKLVKKYEDMGYSNDDAILHAEKDMVAKYGEDWNSYLEEDEVSDEKISEALADYQWQITDSDTVGSYAQSVADKLGCSKEQVLKVIRNEDENISENDSMAKVAGLKEDKPDATTYNGAEVIGGDDDIEGILKDETPLTKEESENFEWRFKPENLAIVQKLQKMGIDTGSMSEEDFDIAREFLKRFGK